MSFVARVGNVFGNKNEMHNKSKENFGFHEECNNYSYNKKPPWLQIFFFHQDSTTK